METLIKTKKLARRRVDSIVFSGWGGRGINCHRDSGVTEFTGVEVCGGVGDRMVLLK